MRSIDDPWQAQSTRDATEEERQLFKFWMGGAYPLYTKPFRLKIQADPIHCTVLNPEDDLYVLGENDVAYMRQHKKILI